MKVKLLLYSSETCSVCRSLKPKLEGVARKFNAEFKEVSMDENLKLVSSRLIFSVPVVLLEVDGREVNRWAGIFSISEVEEFLKRVL